MDLYCPDCGRQTLEIIEITDPDPSGEFKDVCTCEECGLIVYIVRFGRKEEAK